MDNTPPEPTKSEDATDFADVLSALDGQDWTQTSDLELLSLDLERFIGNIEQRRNQIQVQGRALTEEEEQYLDRTGDAMEPLRQALAALRVQ